MKQSEVLDHLNKLNSLVAEFQKHLVVTISRISREGIEIDGVHPDVQAAAQAALATPAPAELGRLPVSTVDAALGAVKPLTPEQLATMPPAIQEAHRRLQEAMQGLGEAVAANRLGTPGVEGLRAARAAQLSGEAAAEFPTLSKAAAPATPANNEPPPLGGANGPTLSKMSPAQARIEQVDQAQQAATVAKAEHAKYMTGLFHERGSLAQWFSAKAMHGGLGFLEPVNGKNLYDNDISTLPYARLKDWPEGFYQNERLGSFQYLGHTPELLFTIDFGVLGFDGDRKHEAVKVVFHTDAHKRVLPVSVLETELLAHVLSVLAHHMSDIRYPKQ
jgi:hypothetical protein